ncbi:lysylphosphatidylglycerol synthase domain-containing protein [Actinomyces haliotis]|uniref:lysylphosphatidylglycerol synthase domain-containing protein n=1 Tax=Actinomyces haliotis TaxID=1280843 RepID=UPI0018906FD6|nr:lysylphosphatidylglycerol synthase domain-containing protein [Actinomyces haliotis]
MSATTRAGRSPRKVLTTVLKWLIILVAVVFLAREVVSQWAEVKDVLAVMPVWSVVASVVLAMGAVAASGEQQRLLLLALGHDIARREWFAVFFAAQLGKYVPGTAWAYVSQMELSRAKGVRRASSVIVMLLGAGMTVLASFAVGLVAAPYPTVGWLPVWLRALAGALGIVGLVILSARPAVFAWAVRHLPERARVDTTTLDGVRHLWTPTAWTLLATVLYGLHVLVLATVTTPGDASEMIWRALGGFATAWVVGFLAIIVPAGVGVREVILVAFLAPVTGAAAALTVTVLSRFLIIIAETLLLGTVPIVRRRY